MREKTVEASLRKAVEDAGGLCLKWVCPGHTGVPDRIILFPYGVIAFVELKRPGAKVKAAGLQEWWGKKLREFGFRYFEVGTVGLAKEVASYLAADSHNRFELSKDAFHARCPYSEDED